MALALAVFLWLASGFALVNIGWPRRTVSAAEFLLQASLAIGFGLGLFSLIFFLSLVFHFTHLLLTDSIVCALLICAGVFRRQAKTPHIAFEETSVQFPAWFHRVLSVCFGVALAGALYAAIMRMLAFPHGDGWDSFAIWNLHARFLFRGGENWHDGFTTLLPWSHPDYPLLLPAAVAHFWRVLGRESPVIPSLIAFAFTFAAAGTLFSALLMMRGRMPAMLAGLVLLSTPAFITQGTSQYADTPLSFFILAALALLNLRDAVAWTDPSHSTGLLALTGIASALAAWTKNEGLLFFLVIMLVQFRHLIPFRSPRGNWIATARHATTIVIAAAPVLLVVAYFKHSAPHSDEVFSSSSSTLHKLLEPARYGIILQRYAKEFLRFGHWLLVPATAMMIALGLIAGRDREITHRPSFLASVLAVGLTLAGYAGIYLVASYEIHWHLFVSLNRLFLQCWPAAIFLFFLALRYSGQARTTP
jgi:hypothetical protein